MIAYIFRMESYLQNQYTLALVLNRIKHVATLTIVVVQISTYYPWLEAPRVLRANLAFLTLLDVSVPHVTQGVFNLRKCILKGNHCNNHRYGSSAYSGPFLLLQRDSVFSVIL